MKNTHTLILLFAFALSGCSGPKDAVKIQKSESENSAATIQNSSTNEETAGNWDQFALNRTRKPLSLSKEIEIRQDSLRLTSRNNHPVIALDKVFDAGQGTKFEVSVDFDLMTKDETTVTVITAWCFDENDVLLPQNNFVSFLAKPTLGKQTITAIFSADPSHDHKGIKQLDPNTRRIVFTTNPVRNGDAVQADFYDLKVKLVNSN